MPRVVRISWEDKCVPACTKRRSEAGNLVLRESKVVSFSVVIVEGTLRVIAAREPFSSDTDRARLGHL